MLLIFSEWRITNEPKKEYPREVKSLRKNTWAIEDIFPTDEAWEKALEDFKKLPEKVAAIQGQTWRKRRYLCLSF
ncbi:hypothetical protein [Ruminococcus albus]|uniref:hypothetical protein n=1 Tax=Ruminococcus albus TaxID=1264 RepID=UPI001FA81683|nr:hypothetical protein [Ruminococcus albus]